MDTATERALHEADELELVTTGRATGRTHSVRLWFVYVDGVIWLRTGETAADPEASGVRRRTSADRETDWLRNLEQDPRSRIRVGGAEIEARYEPSSDPDADLRQVVDLMRAKYGAEWVGDWYVDRGRIPVRLRPVI